VSVGATLTNGFDLAIIPNVNFNTATSEYTCTEPGLYKVSVSLGVACTLAGTYDGRILITINGLPSQIGSGVLICTVPANCNNTVSCNQLLQLTQGDVIGFTYAWAGSMPSFTTVQSGCFIVQKL
jgi:hypothetical protein